MESCRFENIYYLYDSAYSVTDWDGIMLCSFLSETNSGNPVICLGTNQTQQASFMSDLDVQLPSAFGIYSLSHSFFVVTFSGWISYRYS